MFGKTTLGLSALVLMASLAMAAPVTYTAILDGPSEEPPSPSPGTGTATVTIDPVAHTLEVTIHFMDLVGTTTASHIHVINGPGDANTSDTLGPVATQTPSFIGFPLGVTAGDFNNTYDTTLASSYRAAWITDSGGTTAAAEAALFSAIAEGRAYVNIHTTFRPAGEIRGFLVPEPASLGLLAGLGLFALGRARRA